jgi:hypothetical protein
MQYMSPIVHTCEGQLHVLSHPPTEIIGINEYIVQLTPTSFLVATLYRFSFLLPPQ